MLQHKWAKLTEYDITTSQKKVKERMRCVSLSDLVPEAQSQGDES